MEGFLPGEECGICRGRCCKEHGCSLSPEDLIKLLGGVRPNVSNVEELLTSKDGLYAIDTFGGAVGQVYFIRMRHKCYTFIGIDAMGECIALTEKGCSLSYEERPTGGRCLKSSPAFACVQQYDGAAMESDWLPYQDILKSIWNKYYDKFEAEGIFDACDEEYFKWQKENSLK